jgi:hypothetical protein
MATSACDAHEACRVSGSASCCEKRNEGKGEKEKEKEKEKDKDKVARKIGGGETGNRKEIADCALAGRLDHVKDNLAVLEGIYKSVEEMSARYDSVLRETVALVERFEADAATADGGGKEEVGTPTEKAPGREEPGFCNELLVGFQGESSWTPERYESVSVMACCRSGVSVGWEVTLGSETLERVSVRGTGSGATFEYRCKSGLSGSQNAPFGSCDLMDRLTVMGFLRSARATLPKKDVFGVSVVGL